MHSYIAKRNDQNKNEENKNDEKENEKKNTYCNEMREYDEAGCN